MATRCGHDSTCSNRVNSAAKSQMTVCAYSLMRAQEVVCMGLRSVPALQEELKDFFPTLLDFAGALTSAAPEASRKAGAATYVSLFLQFDSSFHRQVERLSCHFRKRRPTMPASEPCENTASLSC